MSDATTRIEARMAVADLIHRYARHVRMDEPEAVSDLFTPDGVFEIREGYPDRPEHKVRVRLEGRAAVHGHLAPNKGQPHPIPLIHNLIVQVDGATASANCVMRASIIGTEHQVFGEYYDRFVCDGGEWYFSERRFTIFTAASSV
jgi:hypothetical protein